MSYGTYAGVTYAGTNGPINASGLKFAFIIGPVGNVQIHKNAFITTVHGFPISSKSAFIANFNLHANTHQAAFMYGAGLQNTKNSYLAGKQNLIQSKSSYITANNTSSTQKLALASGRDNLSVSKITYINAAYNTDETAIRIVGSRQQYVNIPSNTNFSLTNFTIENWVRIRDNYATNDSYKPLWSLTGCASLYFDQDALHFFIDGNFGNGYVRTAQSIDTINTLSGYNRWMKFVTTYDGANYRLYINGKLECSSVATGLFNGGNNFQSNSMYLGAQPGSNRYTNTDHSKFAVYNYAKTGSQITAEFIPVSRIVSKFAYIQSPLPTVQNRSGSKLCFISMGGSIAGFATPKPAYIVAGGETTTYFDLKIETVPATKYTTTTYFDLAIRWSTSTKFLNKVLGPTISYPITRTVIYRLPLLSRDGPGIATNTNQSYLHAGWSLTSSKIAYINYNLNNTGSFLQAFVNGTFISAGGVQAGGTRLAYIQSQASISVSKNAYINYNQPTFVASSLQLFISGSSSNTTASRSSYIFGGSNSTNSKVAFIVCGQPGVSSLAVFINTIPMYPIQASKYSYIASPQSRQKTLPAFVFGVYKISASQNAFISVVPFASSSIGCTIMYSIAGPFSTILNYIRAWDSISSTHSAYLFAQLNLIAGQSCYIGGLGHTYDGRQFAHIMTQGLGSTSVSRNSYLNNYSGSVTQNRSCYISSQIVLSSKQSFIQVIAGTTTVSMSSYIVAGLYSSKNMFLVSIGSRASTAFAYINYTTPITQSKLSYINA